MIRIFIGFDQIEAVAYHAACQSIINHATEPVSIIPLKLSMLPMYTREVDQYQSNEFSYSRYLVPYLCDYKGWAIFMDSDMLLRTDIRELWGLRDNTKSVQVVKHDYTPKNQTKFLGVMQYSYPRKNWSSMMLMNCSHRDSMRLNPATVNSATAQYLHRFQWTEDEMIGELPVEWNHLVGEYEPNPDAKIAHFTVGGPYFNEYRDVEFADEWRDVLADTTHCDQIGEAKRYA